MSIAAARACRYLAMALLLGTAPVQTPAGTEQNLAVRDIGSFYVGGQSVSLRGLPERSRVRREQSPPEKVDPNGDFETGQIYVQYVKLARPRGLPLLLLPGGSVTGVTYETTPDGRPGWQLLFLRDGYDVYIADTAQAGRAPWARFPEINPDEPAFRAKQFIWEIFRVGPEGSYGGRRPYADTRFPVAAFDEFAKQAAPRFRMSREQERQGYEAVIIKVCPCTIVAHSAAGQAALEAAARYRQLVGAVVLVEPSAVPATDEVAPREAPPLLFLWGDHLDLADVAGGWAKQYFAAQRFHDALRAGGGHSTWIYLPDRDIRGNSHMLMMDDNSAQVARMIQQWIEANVQPQRH